MTAGKEYILIVDDEAIIRKLLLNKLSREGYVCQEAGNAAEAVEKLNIAPAALALLDVKMPGGLGTELLLEIKTSYPDTAVIMVTAITDVSLAIQCMKEGAYDYITKPFNLDEVVINVSRALEKRRLELENREYHQHLEQRVQEQAQRIRTSFLNAVTSLAYALEAKDKYTSGHSQRVSEMAVMIAKELGIPREGIDKIRLAGLIHDIGKMGVKESILNKPGELSKEEFEHIKRHPEIGERILGPIVDDEEILKMVRHHHERYDGSGYPDGLVGERIPLGARILAVCDAYDAITSKRPYRAANDNEIACVDIEEGKNTQFDPRLIDILLKVKRYLPAAVR